jgi:DNA-binding transcriptional LysR family regulator
MGLAAHQLDAFHAVARSGSFSAAARALHVTQSALSQRVLNLEEELGAALFVRDPAGARLTAIGETLLRYCRTREALEAEFLTGLSAPATGQLAGVLRVAGFSTVIRSVVLPALSDLVVRNPHVQLEVMVKELRDLPNLLRTGGADLVLLDRELGQRDVRSHHLGFEENVLVEAGAAPRGGKSAPLAEFSPDDVYLDHDADDPTTEEFWRLQTRRPTTFRRQFLDEVYGLLDGVRAGWGRAVVPRHLVRDEKAIRVVPGLKPLKVPVILHDARLPYYPKLHAAAVDALVKIAPRCLAP